MNQQSQQRTLLERGHDVSALWDALLPSIPNPGLTQAIRWAKQFSDEEIETAFSRTNHRFRHTEIPPERAHRYTTGTLVALKRERSTPPATTTTTPAAAQQQATPAA